LANKKFWRIALQTHPTQRPLDRWLSAPTGASDVSATKDIDLPKHGSQTPTSQILHPLLALAMHAELPGGALDADLSLHDSLLNLLKHRLTVLKGEPNLFGLNAARWAFQARHLLKFKGLASKPRFDPDDEFHGGILGRRSIDLYAKNWPQLLHSA
jgi:hypothetical protein